MNRKPIAWMFALGSLLALSGCATQYVASPTSGRSRLEQILLSSTIDEAVNQMTQQGLDPLTGKKVFVRVGDLEDEERNSDYVKATVELRLASLGVVPVERDEAADAVLVVRVRAAGVDRSSRVDSLSSLLSVFGLLFTYHKVWSAAELEAQAIDQKNSAILLPTARMGSADNYWTEWSFLPILFSAPYSLRIRPSTVESDHLSW